MKHTESLTKRPAMAENEEPNGELPPFLGDFLEKGKIPNGEPE